MLHYLTRTRTLVVVIITLIILRIITLPLSPPGFFLDEAASGAHVIAMLANWTNAHGEFWPLFSSSLGGGYTTPIYLYPVTLWAALFGTSELALRLFSQVATIGAVLLLGWSLRLWLDKKAAYAAVIIGLALPWGWLQGSLAWDPALIPLVMSLSFYAFSLIWFALSYRYKIIGHVLLPTSLVALAYLYPPCRVTAPLLYVGAYYLLYRYAHISLRHLLIVGAYSALIALPLLVFILQPEALARSREVSVFHDTPLLFGIGHVIANIFLMINPVFLFIFGDPNLRHATGYQGMLGVAAVLPLAVLAWHSIGIFKHASTKSLSKSQSRQKILIVIAAAGVIAGILGSALTNEGQPHSLRASAAWLFIVILLAVGSTMIWRSRRRWLKISAVAIFTIGTSAYAVDLTLFYPSRAAESFDASVRAEIQQGQSPAGYPDLSLEYYRSK